MKSIEMRQKANEAAEKAAGILTQATAEGRSVTAVEALEAKRHTRAAEQLLHDASRLEVEALQGVLSAPQARKTNPVMCNGEVEVHSGLPYYRSASLRSFRGPKAEQDALRSGMWLLATIGGNERARKYCQNNHIEFRGNIEGVNTAGGFLVPDEMERSIINLRDEYGDARRECRVINMGSDHMTIPRRSGGLTSYFTGESAEITESDASWTQVTLTARKLAVLTRISSELSEDAVISVADLLAGEIALAFATKEDQCCIDGDGTSTYGGMVGVRSKMIDGNHAGSYVDNSSGADEWSEITDNHLIAVMAALPKYARRNAKWHCSPAAKNMVFDRLMRAAGGNTMLVVAAGAGPQYMGYPIVEWSAMPAVSAGAVLNNKIMLFFGDLAQAVTIGSRRGITLQVDGSRYLERDEIALRGTERFDINVHDIGGSGADDRGPIVGMLGGT